MCDDAPDLRALQGQCCPPRGARSEARGFPWQTRTARGRGYGSSYPQRPVSGKPSERVGGEQNGVVVVYRGAICRHGVQNRGPTTYIVNEAAVSVQEMGIGDGWMDRCRQKSAWVTAGGGY